MGRGDGVAVGLEDDAGRSQGGDELQRVGLGLLRLRNGDGLERTGLVGHGEGGRVGLWVSLLLAHDGIVDEQLHTGLTAIYIHSE